MTLPKGWRTINGRPGFYYAVPERVRHLWDNKQTFKLGETEAEAFKTWFERTGGMDEIDKLTVSDLLDTFLREYVAVYLAGTTYDTYKYHVLPLKRVFGHLHPKSIEPHHVYRYMNERPRSAANREASVLSSALSFAVEKGWLKQNSIKHQINRRGSRKESPRKRAPTREELEAFTTGSYASVYRPDTKSESSREMPICPQWLRGYVALKMITGLRKGQMLSINLTEHWDNGSETLTPPTSKGGKPTQYRGGALSSCIREILGGRLPVGPLFLNTRGVPVTVSGVNSAWRRAMARFVEAGGEKFNEHDIRKYTANEAETLEHAQKLLGHQSPKVTARVYRVAPENVEVLE